jgi:hypothetical protein
LLDEIHGYLWRGSGVNKSAVFFVITSPLLALGIEMDFVSFAAGMLFALPMYYLGRQIWKEHSELNFWQGMLAAELAAIIVASTPAIIPFIPKEVPVPIRMAIAAGIVTLLITRLRKEGKEFTDGSDS